ncbi:IS5 family transposase [Glycomyces sp. NPDC047010]|uniref:IS5 family transposase n=1 Tax=Glycomyces sp. NPDC047010 TaxID=3155023 RepID=UPI0033FBD3D6
MVKPWLIDEGLWSRISVLLPEHRPGKRGPVPLDDRKCLQGILFVLYTGISWKHLPPELGFGSGITCWRRFRRWSEAGVWDRLHRMLLSELHALGEIDWSAVCLDSSHVRAKKGGDGTGPSPVDRGRSGSKHHIACDSTGVPLAVMTTAGNVPDITVAPDLVEAIPPVAGRVGHPRRRPDTILADGGYDSAAFREWLRRRRIAAVVPQRGRKKIIGLGSIRWVVEQAIAHLHQFRRLAVRWDRSLSAHQGFVTLAAALVCWRRLRPTL